jgi:hypothetical protein
MSHYGILLPGFWDGDTGRTIARAGGSAAQLVALYLMSNQDANMIGLYRARLPIVRERIGTLPAKGLERALLACGQAAFADYDVTTEHVWVREMAKYRLALHKGPIDRKDKRAEGAKRLYEKAAPNPFLVPFFKRYRTDLHLSKARVYKGSWQPLTSPLSAPLKPEGASKPDISNQDQDHRDQESEDQQEGQDQREDAHRVLVRLAHDTLTEHPSDVVEQKEDLKTRAARANIPYDAEDIRKALDSAEAQRRRRSA